MSLAANEHGGDAPLHRGAEYGRALGQLQRAGAPPEGTRERDFEHAPLSAATQTMRRTLRALALCLLLASVAAESDQCKAFEQAVTLDQSSCSGHGNLYPDTGVCECWSPYEGSKCENQSTQPGAIDVGVRSHTSVFNASALQELTQHRSAICLYSTSTGSAPTSGRAPHPSPFLRGIALITCRRQVTLTTI